MYVTTYNGIPYNRLDPEKKRVWLEALRSKNYTQGNQTLKNHRGYFCCLGVYADAVEHVEWKKEVNSNPDQGSFEYFVYDQETYSGSLPNYMVDEKAQPSLMAMNDSESLSFNEIADWVEENL